jgi:hypothetical protein
MKNPLIRNATLSTFLKAWSERKKEETEIEKEKGSEKIKRPLTSSQKIKVASCKRNNQ